MKIIVALIVFLFLAWTVPVLGFIFLLAMCLAAYFEFGDHDFGKSTR